MYTVMAFLGLGTAFVVNEAAIALVRDVRLAMKRADLSLDYVARATGVPIPRLSDQLNGKTPFTALWRFFASEELRGTDFAHEFFALQAARVDRMCVKADLGALLTKLDTILESSAKAMVKADLVMAQTRRKEAC